MLRSTLILFISAILLANPVAFAAKGGKANKIRKRERNKRALEPEAEEVKPKPKAKKKKRNGSRKRPAEVKALSNTKKEVSKCEAILGVTDFIRSSQDSISFKGEVISPYPENAIELERSKLGLTEEVLASYRSREDILILGGFSPLLSFMRREGLDAKQLVEWANASSGQVPFDSEAGPIKASQQMVAFLKVEQPNLIEGNPKHLDAIEDNSIAVILSSATVEQSNGRSEEVDHVYRIYEILQHGGQARIFGFTKDQVINLTYGLNSSFYFPPHPEAEVSYHFELVEGTDRFLLVLNKL